jgi:hypothetical protein
MEAFQQALDDCRLFDLGFSGSKFTWFNGRARNEAINERLDRGLANSAWLEVYDLTEV